MKYIVMTSAAKMPVGCWGRYRNVAVVAYKSDTPPRTIRNTRTAQIVLHYGPQHVGRTERCAYQRALAKARAKVEEFSAAS